MSRSRPALVALLGLACAVLGAALGYLGARARSAERAEPAPPTRIERGRRIAERTGCFGCHGPGGTDPIPNPGAVYGSVPDWGDAARMSLNASAADVRAWIVDGHPPGRAADREALIRMPAFGDQLSEAELEDLVAYVLAVARFGQPEERQARQGREIALRYGCFGCHGPEGRGMTPNPGSYTGYVPPWDGQDYTELVRDDEEFRQWVRNGISERFRVNPLARGFLERQRIRMPAYGEHLDDTQIDALLAYVKWVRANPRP